MRERNERFYTRYPEDRARVLELLERFASEPAELPSGDRLHPARVRQLGAMLGMSDGCERLHHILELDPDSPAFLHDVEQASSFARNPIYAILHEACWANGTVTGWSAQRMLDERSDWPEELLTGEHIFPWMFEEATLEPLREAAELLARREWPALYDIERLRANEVPAAALVYSEDLIWPGFSGAAFLESSGVQRGGSRCPAGIQSRSRRQVVELARSGTRVAQLAETFGMSEAVIYGWLKQERSTGVSRRG